MNDYTRNLANIATLRRQSGITDHIVHSSGRKKNVCASYVVMALGVPAHRFNYAQNLKDILRIIRRRAGYSAKALRSKLPKDATVADAKRWIHNNARANEKFIIMVRGHVLLLDSRGNIIVDTDPVEGLDTRPLIRIYSATR